MTIYQELDNRIKLISTSRWEYFYFKKIVTEYFEGYFDFNKMPDSLKLTLAEWENEQEEKGR
jgi:hypothetical protein